MKNQGYSRKFIQQSYTVKPDVIENIILNVNYKQTSKSEHYRARAPCSVVLEPKNRALIGLNYIFSVWIRKTN